MRGSNMQLVKPVAASLMAGLLCWLPPSELQGQFFIGGGLGGVLGASLAGATALSGAATVVGAPTVSGPCHVGAGSVLAAGTVVAAGSVLNGHTVATATTL